MAVCRIGGVTGMDGVEVEVAAPGGRAGAAGGEGIYGVGSGRGGGIEGGGGKGSGGPPDDGWTGPAVGHGRQKTGLLDRRAGFGCRTGRFGVVVDPHHRRRRLRGWRKTKL